MSKSESKELTAPEALFEALREIRHITPPNDDDERHERVFNIAQVAIDNHKAFLSKHEEAAR